jgi:adenylate cyclase
MTCRPSPEEIQAALARIVESRGFAGAERMRRFIRFIVEKTLSGNTDALKEYPIGVEVFDRGTSFDPQTDTIVRVEAARLRRKLEEFYADAGKRDPILIRVQRGCYKPVIEWREIQPAVAPTPGDRHPESVDAPAASVAVLPFLDLSPRKTHEHLCDGFSEELTNALSAVPTLKVAARTSAFRFKGKSDDIPAIGGTLGVLYVVEGSIRTSQDRLRITVQLVRAADGYYIWSRQFDRTFVETFALQDEIARQVAASVGVELGSGVSFAKVRSPEAYRRYLEGRHYWRKFAPEYTAQAIACFEEAIRLEPAFAPAYAGLADSYMQMSIYGRVSPIPIWEKARDAATQALDLDSACSEAETVLGTIRAFADWNWEVSELHFRRAIQIRPNNVEARWLFATVCLGPQGRLDEALAEVRRAVDGDPLSPLSHSMLGAVYFYRGQYDEALQTLATALRLDPSYSQALLFMGFVHVAQGRFDLASGGQDQSPYRLYVQAKLGLTSVVEAEIEKLMNNGGNPLSIAAGYAGLHQTERSLDWLEKAAEFRLPQLIWLDFQGHWESLRSSDRYRAIRARMGLGCHPS